MLDSDLAELYEVVTINAHATQKVAGHQMVHSARVELTTFAFGGQRSIQLSYECENLSLSYLFLPTSSMAFSISLANQEMMH